MSTLPTPASIFEITLLRHGESTGNAGGIYQGQMDFDLTERGAAQVQALAERWQRLGRSFDRILSSPLRRARQTAEIISQALDLPVEYDPIWMERDHGKLSGLTLEEGEVRYPRPAFTNPYNSVADNGESLWELYLRAGQAVQKLVNRPVGRYLIVSHGAFLNMFMYAVLGIVPQANFSGVRFRFTNTSVAELRYDPGQHVWLLESINDRQHLRAEPKAEQEPK
jgi:broad specificity phosphatase PhoE